MGGECFTPNTQIRMGDGTRKAISDVKVGDVVRGIKSDNNVLATPIFLLDINSLYGWNDETPWTTGMHPFFSRDGWSCFEPDLFADHFPGDYRHVADLNTCMEVLMLEDGDDVYKESGGWSQITEIDILEERDDFTVYNLMLDGDHTFFANGYLVHNKGGADPGDDAIGVAAANESAEAAAAGMGSSVGNTGTTSADTDAQGVTGDGTGVGAISGDDPNSAGITGLGVDTDPGIGDEGGQNGTAQGLIDTVFGQSMVDQVDPTAVGLGLFGLALNALAPPLGMAFSVARGMHALSQNDTAQSVAQGFSSAIGADTSATEGNSDPSVGADGTGATGPGGDGTPGSGGDGADGGDPGTLQSNINTAISNPVTPPPTPGGGSGVTTTTPTGGSTTTPSTTPSTTTRPTQTSGTSAATGADGGVLSPSGSPGDVPGLGNEAVSLTARRARALASLRRGRRSTILTRGLDSDANATFKTLLGS